MQANTIKHLYTILLCVFMIYAALSSSAQHGIVVIDSTADGRIKFARVTPNPSNLTKQSTDNDSKLFLKRVLKAGSNTDFYLYKVVTDELGMQHEKYQQTYHGVNVEFSEFIVHRDKSGNIESINGDFERIKDDFSISPDLRFDDAFIKLKGKDSGKRYTILPLIEKKNPVKDSTMNARFKLVIIRGYDNQLHLAYKANLCENSYTDRYWGYIDCTTGDIVFKQPRVSYTNSPTTVQTIYSGPKQITVDSYTNGYRLRENSRGGTNTAIRTLNFNYAPHSDDIGETRIGMKNAFDFVDYDNNWTAAEHSYNGDNAAFDAHWGAEMTVDYFRTVHIRNSYDGLGDTIRNYVHVMTKYCDPHSGCTIINLKNALWDPDLYSMFYGDGDSNKPFVCLDMVAHEIGHGVCHTSVGISNSGLENEKESGALDESLSDIWAACVTYWVTNDSVKTWLCAEDIVSGGARSMGNPKSKGQPSTYKGALWVNTDTEPNNSNDYCGIHTNSGVGNYWFYLLVNGGAGTNDIGNTYNVTGIGISDATKIVYLMETAFLIPSSKYNDARTGSISKATSNFGANSLQNISVTNAWYAVGVGDKFQLSGVSLTGPSTVCASGATFTVNNLPAGFTVLWNKSANLNPPTASGNSAIFTVNGTGNGWVEATVYTSYYSQTLTRINVVVGNPTPTIDAQLLSGPGEPTSVLFTATPYSNSTYSWYVSNVLKQSGVDNTLQWYFPCRVTKTINCKLTNSCGTSGFSNSLTETGSCDRTYSYSVFPNPASSEVTISQLSKKPIAGNDKKDKLIKSIRVVDKFGNTLYFQKYESKTIESKLNVSNFPIGIYIITINEGDDEESYTIVKQ